MPIHQATLPFPRPAMPRVRSCRRPFLPSEPAGPYRLPRAIVDRLTATLAPFRNREAAFALAVFLGRFWSAPKRLGLPFPIDRRALTDHAVLDLTEARVRGAIGTLEVIGFLDRADGKRRYKATEHGLHRRPILFTFGSEFLAAFEVANRMAFARTHKTTGGRRTPPRVNPTSQASDGWIRPDHTSPKNTVLPKRGMIMGDLQKGSPERRVAPPIEPNSALERALAALAVGVIGNGERRS